MRFELTRIAPVEGFLHTLVDGKLKSTALDHSAIMPFYRSSQVTIYQYVFLFVCDCSRCANCWKLFEEKQGGLGGMGWDDGNGMLMDGMGWVGFVQE